MVRALVRHQLDERQWSKISTILKAGRGAGRPGSDDRNFIEAVLWWRRTVLKQARRFVTRYEKTLRNYGTVVALGCALLWATNLKSARKPALA